jgi:hypothetical protein
MDTPSNPIDTRRCDDIPLPIVRLNRWTIAIAVAAGLALRAPWITTGIFLVVAPAALWGSRASLIYALGCRIYARANLTAPTEDRRLMRFNNALAASMLGAGQIAFLLHQPIAGWALCIATAVAALVALAGFCFGCFLFYRFKLARYRLFGT